MIAFIEAYRADYGVEPICRVLPIAPSTFYHQAAITWRGQKLPVGSQPKVAKGVCVDHVRYMESDKAAQMTDMRRLQPVCFVSAEALR